MLEGFLELDRERGQQGEGARREMAALQGRAQKLAQPATLYGTLATMARTLKSGGIAFEPPEDLGALGFRGRCYFEARISDRPCSARVFEALSAGFSFLSMIL